MFWGVKNMYASLRVVHGKSLLCSQTFTFIIITTLSILCSCQVIHGRKSPDLIVKDPKKYILIEENDIFDVSEAPSDKPSLSPSTSIIPSKAPSIKPTSDPSEYPTSLPSEVPSVLPSQSPSSKPSNEPSQFPTSNPSIGPSNEPSRSPSRFPSSIPSNSPSIAPATESPIAFYPLGYTPDLSQNENRSYFNYNPNDGDNGPGQPNQNLYYFNDTEEETFYVLHEKVITSWETTNVTSNITNTTSLVNTTKHQYVNETVMNVINKTTTKSYEYTEYIENGWTTVKKSNEYNYWEIFDMNRTLGNRCGSEPWRTQSPIDLCDTHVTTECKEHHQIRTRAGDYNLDDAEVELKILPSKLRIEYSKENAMLDPDVGLLPPHADFPLNWNGYISAVHIDIKIPSEHTICGRRFAGEYQIYFYHPGRRQPIVQSILMEIHPKNRPHLHFQKALNEWQALFDLKQMECQNLQRNLTRMEARFARRMNNFLRSSVDSDEFSPIEDGARNDFLDGTVNDASKELDDEEERLFQMALRRAKDRVSNPRFEEVYEGINITTTVDSEALETEACLNDPNTTFALGESNHTCCDLIDPDLSWGCAQDQITEQCPNTCNNNSTATSNPTMSTIPTTSPTSTPRPRWNPFWPRILNSIYFYGYGGSLTEPPCSEWVAWRVLDEPMQISSEQWDQMRNILFGQVDDQCRRTSVHWRGSVARPTQSLNSRPLWKCTQDDYVSDAEKRNDE